MNSYDLSRDWFNYCFDNPEKIKPIHTAMYFFAIEHCNRLGWKTKFGFPSTMVMEATGIKSYNTYINTFNDLVEWGFIKLIEKSKNQYSSNIIALSNNTKAINKALDKALIKHSTKQSESIDSIDKQETINKETINNIYSCYPTKCPIKNSSTGKANKDKDKIEKLLKDYSEDVLTKAINSYIEDCKKSKTYIKNFSTFLNNIPEEYLTDKPQQNKVRKYAVDCGDRTCYYTKEFFESENMEQGGYTIDLNKWIDEY